MVIGDFNSLLRPENKRGGRPISRSMSRDFALCLQDCGLTEFEARGPTFTWESRDIAEMLDWCFGNSNWRNSYPESFVDHLAKQKLDHLLILTRLNNNNSLHIKPFRFQSCWTLDNCLGDLVSSNWLSDADLVPALNHLIPRLQEWNSHEFGNIFRRKAKLLCRLTDI